jgi:hypothetical protein
MKRSHQLREAANLSAKVQQRLNMYAVCASAAGMAVLALPQAAEAKIIYTPAHVQVAPHQIYGIDFDHDGVADISLGRGTGEGATFVWASGRDGVAAVGDNRRLAVAVFRGAKIGASRHFVQSSSFEPTLAVASTTGTMETAKWRGQWADEGLGVKNRYLGVKLKINGQVNFGWARVTITIDDRKRAAISGVLLTGYAYETTPNMPIIAGATKDAADENQPAGVTFKTNATEPATLGVLALGAPGLSIWKRQEDVVAAP